MIAEKLQKTALWLFVINLGVVLGAGLYEARIEVPQWLVDEPSGLHWNAEKAKEANTGLRFWIFASTIPLTLLTLVNLIFAFRSSGVVRRWWLTASLTTLAERLATFFYFIPVMIGLMETTDVASNDAVKTALEWVNLNYIRHILVIVALLSALKTFQLDSFARGKPEQS